MFFAIFLTTIFLRFHPISNVRRNRIDIYRPVVVNDFLPMIPAACDR